MLAEMLFIVCAAMLIYVYLLFPFGVMLAGWRRRNPSQPRWPQEPTVTMIFAAYNEEENIIQKLDNALGQDYPEDKLDVIVVDDCSQDRTPELIEYYRSPRVRWIRQARRLGKTAALNRAVPEARGEVLVFTDANSMYHSDAVRHLVNGFDREETIGVVTGSVKYQQHPSALSDEEGLYHDFDTKLKEFESRVGSLPGAFGPIYAMPRNLYEPLREDLISDFMMSLLLCKRGYRTVHEPRAITVETGTRGLAAEFRRKRRIVQRSLHALSVHRELLNPRQHGWLAVQLWSHKVLRWLTPLWLIGNLVSALLLLRHPFFLTVSLLLLGGLAGALIGYVLRWLGLHPGLFRFPSYAIMVFSASLAGIYDWLRGKYHITWEPQR
ncbi:MAG TPA: glycosyltransferase family 2 protein [bacterium]|jgi:cellulose synthase/poly-beta-1,6-N-acetylglucosamine synthase-like glycosyltransferase